MNKLLISGAWSVLMLASTQASAQQAPATQEAAPPPAAAAAPPPPAPAPTGPSMTSARTSIDPTTQTLIDLQRKLELERAKGALAVQQNETAKASGQAQGATNGTADLPQLVGLVSRGNVVWAEFLTGDAISQVQPGGWVTTEWRLVKTMSNGVELVSRSGRQKHTLLFGGGSTSRGSQGYERQPGVAPGPNGY